MTLTRRLSVIPYVAGRFSLRALVALLRLLPPNLAAPLFKRIYDRLATDAKTAKIISSEQLPGDAFGFVVHQRNGARWIYVCEDKDDAQRYYGLAKRTNASAAFHRSVPDGALEGRCVYFPALVRPGEPVSEKRQRWINDMRRLERARLARELGLLS